MNLMLRPLSFLGALIFAGALCAPAQQNPKPQPPLPPSDATPRSSASQNQNGEWKDDEGFIHRSNSNGSSSSKDTEVDLTPPPDDAKNHPGSSEALREAEDAAGLLEGDEIGGMAELRPWDPHKAMKDIEVGDFYFRRKNYYAALDRYQEALYYQNNNAVATFRLAVCQEKVGDSDEARKNYQAYLNILPQGPYAKEAHEALARLTTTSDQKQNAPDASQAQKR